MALSIGGRPRRPFEVILGAYLTQNTAWKAVELSLANLRAAERSPSTACARYRRANCKHLIRPTGFPTRKAPALKAFVAMLDEEFGGSLEVLAATPTATLRPRFLALPGVGPETADAILLYASTIRSLWPTSICAASPSGTSLSHLPMAAFAMTRWPI